MYRKTDVTAYYLCVSMVRSLKVIHPSLVCSQTPLLHEIKKHQKHSQPSSEKSVTYIVLHCSEDTRSNSQRRKKKYKHDKTLLLVALIYLYN